MRRERVASEYLVLRKRCIAWKNYPLGIKRFIIYSLTRCTRVESIVRLDRNIRKGEERKKKRGKSSGKRTVVQKIVSLVSE